MADVFYLPRATEAVIPADKLVDYALNTEHPRGRHKARVFRSALGSSGPTGDTSTISSSRG